MKSQENLMSKTITIRLDDDSYEILKTASAGVRRSISNYIEFAALNFTLYDNFVDKNEMEDIHRLLPGIQKGLDDVKNGRYIVVG